MIEIPLIAVPNQQLNIILNDQNCTIAIYQRDTRMFLDLFVGQNAVRKGMICLPFAPIISKPCDFSGQLRVIDSLSSPQAQQPPEYSELGTRYKLYYLSPEEEAQISND